jgi:hypothetical protein
MDPYEYPVEPLRSEDEIAKDVETIRNAVKGFGTDEKVSQNWLDSEIVGVHLDIPT